MFWIKKRKASDISGYLYLRESIYERDKRSYTKKPKKLGSGKKTLEKNKYTKKKDIYCGKIIELKPKKLISFKDYIIKKKKKKDFTEYKINSAFDELLYDFIDYLLDIHKINKIIFFSEKKQVYQIANGYLCKPTINFLEKFEIKGKSENKKELERFASRCTETGIFDEEIISALYLKLQSTKYDYKIDEKEQTFNLEKREHKDLMDFLKSQ